MRCLSSRPDISRRASAGRHPYSELEQIIRDLAHSGNLRPDDALNLFDELLKQTKPASAYAYNHLLNAVSRAPASSSVRDGPVLAVSLFNRMASAGAKKVAPDICTYGILIGCCCRVGRLDLGFTVLGRIIKTGCGVNAIAFNNLLKGLCAKKRVGEAMDIVVRRMTELGCTPDVVSYTILLKGLCDEKRSQESLELLHMMVDDEGSCMPDDALALFREMLSKGVKCDVITYNTILHGLFQTGRTADAKELYNKMIKSGILLDIFTYGIILEGLCKNNCVERMKPWICMLLSRPMV